MAGKDFPLSIILRTVDRATSGIRKVTKRIDNLGETTAKVGRSLTTGLTLPLAGVGFAATRAFSEFEAGMSNISTLIDTSTESLEDMGKEVLAIGRRVPVAIDDLTSSLYDVRSAGVAAEDQFEVLEQSARLATAGLGTTGQAVDLVTSSINAFGLEGEKAERVYDSIFKTVKNGKTNIQQLSQGFGAVAGTVAATGTELDEYLASVAALTTTGLPAAQAHTQLRSVISGLTRETADSRKVFRALGAKDFPDLIDKAGGLVPALEQITDELGGNEAQILKLVGSTEALNAVLGLTGGQNRAFNETLRDMREGANAVDEAFEKQNKTTRAKWQRTKNALTSAGVEIGKILTPALEKVAEALRSATKWFTGLDEDTQEWLVTMAGVAAVVGPVLLIIGKVSAAVSALSAALGVATSAVWRFLGVVGIIVAGIVSWISVIRTLVTRWDEVTAAVRFVLDRVEVRVGQFVDWFKGVWDGVKDFFAELWEDIKGIFQDAWEFIAGIVEKVSGAVDKVVGFGKKVGEVAGKAGAVLNPFGAVVDAGRSLFGGDDSPSATPSPDSPALSDILRGDFGPERERRSRIELDIRGAPPGTRVETDPGNDDDVDVSLGVMGVGLL